MLHPANRKGIDTASDFIYNLNDEKIKGFRILKTYNVSYSTLYIKPVIKKNKKVIAI